MISEASITKGGAFYISEVDVSVNTDKTIKMTGNKANNGGVFYIKGSIDINGSGKLNLISNSVTNNGGALFFDNSNLVNINIDMNGASNSSSKSGGVFYFTNCNTVNISSTMTFSSNRATTFSSTYNGDQNLGGGVFYFINCSNINLLETADLTLNSNQAFNGGAVWCWSSNNASTVKFYAGSEFYASNNRSHDNGGGGFFRVNSIIFQGNITLINNRTVRTLQVTDDGGGLYLSGGNIIFDGNIIATGNSSQGTGGVMFIVGAKVTITKNAHIEMRNNSATATSRGGASFDFVSSNIFIDKDFFCINSSNNVAGTTWRGCSGVGFHLNTNTVTVL